MRSWIRYTISAVVGAGFCIGMGLLLANVREAHRLVACKSIEINFPDSLGFVSEKDVKNYIAEGYGNYIGQRIDSVGLAKIENVLEKESAVMRSDAWTTSDGVLHVNIWQRAPILRFMDGQTGFYVDGTGFIFPLHPDWTAEVPVISGNIPLKLPDGYKGEAPDEGGREWISSMLGMYSEINASRTWKNIVDKISVNGQGDVVVKTKRGEELFIFGGPGGLKEKFEKMEKYYSFIAPAKEANYYKSVNLKYKGQIICSQKGI